MEIRNILNMNAASAGGGCGGGSPAILLASIDRHIEKIKSYITELDTTKLNDSGYKIQEIRNKATEAVNVLEEAKTKIEAKCSLLD